MNNYYVANFFSILCAKCCRNRPAFVETTVELKSRVFWTTVRVGITKSEVGGQTRHNL